MNIEEQVGQKLHNLSLERQQEILDVVNSFAEKEASAKTLRNLRGLWRNSGFSLPKKTKLAVKCGATFREISPNALELNQRMACYGKL